jgi:Fibronectin type III domain
LIIINCFNTAYFLADKPGVPLKLRVTAVNKDSVSLAWDAPETDGGSKIKRYVIEKADTKKGTFTETGESDANTLQFKVTKLFEGTEYLFRVSAENAVGRGKPAELPEPVTARLPFGTLLNYFCPV